MSTRASGLGWAVLSAELERGRELSELLDDERAQRRLVHRAERSAVATAFDRDPSWLALREAEAVADGALPDVVPHPAPVPRKSNGDEPGPAKPFFQFHVKTSQGSVRSGSDASEAVPAPATESAPAFGKVLPGAVVCAPPTRAVHQTHSDRGAHGAVASGRTRGGAGADQKRQQSRQRRRHQPRPVTPEEYRERLRAVLASASQNYDKVCRERSTVLKKEFDDLAAHGTGTSTGPFSPHGLTLALESNNVMSAAWELKQALATDILREIAAAPESASADGKQFCTVGRCPHVILPGAQTSLYDHLEECHARFRIHRPGQARGFPNLGSTCALSASVNFLNALPNLDQRPWRWMAEFRDRSWHSAKTLAAATAWTFDPARLANPSPVHDPASLSSVLQPLLDELKKCLSIGVMLVPETASLEVALGTYVDTTCRSPHAMIKHQEFTMKAAKASAAADAARAFRQNAFDTGSPLDARGNLLVDFALEAAETAAAQLTDYEAKLGGAPPWIMVQTPGGVSSLPATLVDQSGIVRYHLTAAILSEDGHAYTVRIDDFSKPAWYKYDDAKASLLLNASWMSSPKYLHSVRYVMYDSNDVLLEPCHRTVHQHAAHETQVLALDTCVGNAGTSNAVNSLDSVSR